MRRVLAAIVATLFLFTSSQSATALEVSISVSEPSHRQMNGDFIDDGLVEHLAFDGKLGELVFSPPRGDRIWFIDPELIEDITAMSLGYKLINGDDGAGVEVATAWLNQLQAITRGDQISALPYGDPSGYWISRLLPGKRNFYLELGANRLTELLGREVNQMQEFPRRDAPKVDNLAIAAFEGAQRALKINAPYMLTGDVEIFQAKSASIFHVNLITAQRAKLRLDLMKNTEQLTRKIRLISGRFTITSNKQDLPITLVNDFPEAVEVSVRVLASNGKLLVRSVADQVIEGSSKIQLMVPVEVVTSGESSILVSLRSKSGKLLGKEVLFPVNLRVISPIATWITTGAAIILFISALIQSYRRIRRKRL